MEEENVVAPLKQSTRVGKPRKNGQPRKPYVWTEKRIRQVKELQEKNAKCREERIEELIKLNREREIEKDRLQLAQTQINTQAVHDSCKIASSQEPDLTSNHLTAPAC